MVDVMYACINMHNMIIEDEVDEDIIVFHAPRSSHITLRRGFIFNNLQVGTSNI